MRVHIILRQTLTVNIRNSSHKKEETISITCSFQTSSTNNLWKNNINTKSTKTIAPIQTYDTNKNKLLEEIIV